MVESKRLMDYFGTAGVYSPWFQGQGNEYKHMKDYSKDAVYEQLVKKRFHWVLQVQLTCKNAPSWINSDDFRMPKNLLKTAYNLPIPLSYYKPTRPMQKTYKNLIIIFAWWPKTLLSSISFYIKKDQNHCQYSKRY